ncbi:helix-turn-helix domain-containing protein (plasmid) [Streptomyces sp. NBC_01335]|uniref:helix-turn-helix domain-containing protein n=1 Tax=Streptomyces sp. NBC_01335 TaxID=2903828 RepID=UPI002E140E93|nr:helix-turn-helix domain-containing protein [Streptomyces sp. NBC_01335]
MHHQPLPDARVLARRRAVGDRIRAARLHAGLTQEAVSLRAGIGLDSYNRIEKGHASPRLDNLIRIADAIGTPLSDLVRDEE